MNPLIQLKKATPLFVIALVLACFALSPQAFAGKVATPTFIPANTPGCQHWINVTVSSTPGASILVSFGQVGIWIPNNSTLILGYLGTLTIQAKAFKWGMDKSDPASATYTYHCP